MAETYKKTAKGTLGAGMNSLFGGASNYYVLEHKVSSKYHKLGEAQDIIVDYVEIGRDRDCAVRFDESFETVSRHHAAIVKKDGNWKLIQLSQTNSTFLNGHKVADEWYLQNGDEIQLSINGPKLGFIIPESNGRKTSLNLTNRMKLFGQQALRPYRNVIIIMGIILLLVIGGGVGYGIYSNKQAEIAGKQVEALQQQLVEQQKRLIEQTEKLMAMTGELDNTKQKLIDEEKKLLEEMEKNAKNEKELEKLKKKQSDLQQQVQQLIDEKKEAEDNKLQENLDYINNY